MKTGSTYLSSPWCFEHAVKYHRNTEKDAVIAVQCRMAFPPQLGREINDRRSDDMREVANIVADCLRDAGANGRVRMPTLEEVKQEEAVIQGLPQTRRSF
eukprot:gnl/TRDRNA2_/TRDRNA2_173305_c1_seq1.p1 gnl/TRDRNA2_/TRDRNA2_173305_c1~~gnl/TRDRNA2_/TRDRNA2_173305_c1_seq1.p1  ORF type:complete len:100 (-),score=13.59 gnl/TRDRNA2_/TRDRNA2_173305_c1_seq1:294-593(-)